MHLFDEIKKEILSTIDDFKNVNKDKKVVNTYPIGYKVFVNTEHFYGYKRFPMVIYGNKLVERNNEKLKDVDLSNKTIIFKPVSDKKRFYYKVFIDDFHIGTIFDETNINHIRKNHFSAVHIMIEPENIIHKNGIDTVHRARVFVKYNKEE